MLRLYAAARSRAAIVQWYLEELAVPYEIAMLDLKAGDHLQESYLRINPMGKVPAIVDEEFTLWESGAILLYLAEKYGNLNTTPEARAEVAQWILFANATLGPGIFVEASRDRELPRLLGPLEQKLQAQPFLIGSQFSVADVAVGSILFYIPLMLPVDLKDYSAISDYVKRLSDRPAFRKTLGNRQAS